MSIPPNFTDHRPTPALESVLQERSRQIGKGYDAKNDDLYTKDRSRSLLKVALFYLEGIRGWPDDSRRRNDLVKAAAVLLAEIERIDRAAGK